MTKERNTLIRDIVALEAKLSPPKQARDTKSSEENIFNALGTLETLVKEACGESFMNDMSYMNHMSYMDDIDDGMDDNFMSYMDEDDDDFDDEDDFDEDIVLAENNSDYPPVAAGAEDEITQEYLDDVLELEKNPASIVTNPSMQDAAPGGHVAMLVRASQRLDKVADYCEKQGNMKLAYHIDRIADSVDTRIKQEA